MTEPDVLGNISPAKFIWENGNTEIINLWRPDQYGGDDALHHMSDGTTNGVDYVVPSSRVFYLLAFYFTEGTDIDLEIQKDTSPDTTDGTTLWKGFALGAGGTAGNATNTQYDVGYCKFVAGEYVNMNQTSGSDCFITAWGVECDA